MPVPRDGKWSLQSPREVLPLNPYQIGPLGRTVESYGHLKFLECQSLQGPVPFQRSAIVRSACHPSRSPVSAPKNMCIEDRIFGTSERDHPRV